MNRILIGFGRKALDGLTGDGIRVEPLVFFPSSEFRSLPFACELAGFDFELSCIHRGIERGMSSAEDGAGFLLPLCLPAVVDTYLIHGGGLLFGAKDAARCDAVGSAALVCREGIVPLHCGFDSVLRLRREDDTVSYPLDRIDYGHC